MTNQLLRALAYDDQVRVFVLDSTGVAEEARQRHQTWHTATAALGRTLAGTLLLSADLQEGDRLSVEILGDGPVGRIVTDAHPGGKVRGFVANPEVALPLNPQGHLDVGGAVGLPGTMIVRKWLGDNEPFMGQVELISGEIAEDFTYYMAVSEQIPTAMGLSVMVNPDESVSASGGFMIQMLPGASEEVIAEVESRVNDLARFSQLLEEGHSLQELLEIIIGPGQPRILSTQSVEFHCDCNRDRFEAGILAIGRSEIEAMIEEDQGAEVVCHYCSEHYDFTKEDLERLLEQAE